MSNFFFNFLVFCQELVPLKTLEPLQLHIQNGLGLYFRQLEPVHQVLFGIVIGGADDPDDLVNVLLGNEESFQEVGPLLGLLQVIPGAAQNNFFLEA